MRKSLPVVAALIAAALPLPAATAQVPQGDPTDLPVLSSQTPRGTGSTVDVAGRAPVAKVADGAIADWVGAPSRYGGTVVYSGGELVYQDHLFDALGADDGRDAARLGRTDPAEEVLPGIYRLDALSQADAPGELGIEVPDSHKYDDTYGDAVDHQDSSDLEEVRVAISGSNLALLARTTTMTSAKDTAAVVLADTAPGDISRTVPFDSGLTTSTADVAVFVADGVVRVADLATGEITSPAGAQAVASPNGFTNALEATVPLASLASPDGSLSLAVASGKPNAEGTGFAPLELELPGDAAYPNVANVAFRLDEPVRIWFERRQALSLNAGTIDPFFLTLDTAALTSGVSQQYVPGPGYHDRIFVSDTGTGVPRENGRDGIFQHYGVYVPASYDGTEAPLQWWLHWRGGTAHSGAAVVPKVMKQLGEDRDTIVVAPSGRGTSTWYVGRGHVDYQEVWADVLDTFSIDRDRVYVTGHSMGGWGSYLLTLLYPDRFAAGAPVAGPVTQGAWTGADFEGCDDFTFEDYSPCYISANESRPRDQHTRKLLWNARHVPLAILHGTSDELVPYSGVARQTERLATLGYRYRFYTYPGYEHYSHPVADQWAEMGSYLHSFTRPANPAHVTYTRDMPFEIATEEVQSGGAKLNFDFDSAYWMSELTPRDPNGAAIFDGRSHALEEDPYVAVPDTTAPTAPGQTGPYVVTGLQWLDDPTRTPAPKTNAFHVSVSDTKAVRLDLGRMDIAASSPIAGTVWTNDGALDLRLDGGWTVAPEVLVDGEAVSAELSSGVLNIPVPMGEHALTITPSGDDGIVTALAFTEDSDSSAQYSDTATLVARLTESGGAPLAGQELSFALGSSSASALTDGDGVATVTLPVADAPGDHAATVSFAGGGDGLNASVGALPFTVTRDDSATTILTAGGKKPLTASLTDADSLAALTGRTIVFFGNGDRIGSAVTNDQGIASFDPPSRYRAKGITFRAEFDGDAFYAGSSASRQT